MSYFAEIDENDIVVNIVVCEKSDIESGEFGDPNKWVETDPHTHGNVHYDKDTNIPDDGTPLRGNYASIGAKYDRKNDVFYPLKPIYDSWVISGPSWEWQPPVPKPQSDTVKYKWNEPTISWIVKPEV
jgi:hypothetical protein